MTLGQQLKKLRMQRELSQPALAEAVGIEQSYLSKLENDKSLPSNDILRKLLVGLDTSLSQFIKPLGRDYISRTLVQIPDVEAWLRARRNQQAAKSRCWLLISSAMIVLATTLFYTGYSKLLFSGVEYVYRSEGVVLPGEPFDYFEHGAFAKTPRDQHDVLRLTMAERYQPHELRTHSPQGRSLIKDTSGGRRHYLLQHEHPVDVIENALMQILAVLLCSCGVMGFVLERRFHQLDNGE